MSLDLRVTWPEHGLAGAYARGEDAATRFYGGGWRDGAAVDARAAAVREVFDRAALETAARALRPSGDLARAKLDRVVEEGGFMVTTGQQPGLFTGPLYTVYKALSAVAVAELLEERLGAPVLPVFWVASEDHDWAEVDHVDLIGVDNELHRVRLPAQEGSDTRPLHRLPLGPGVGDALERVLALLPDTDFSPAYADLLREAWREGATLPVAMGRTMAALLEPFGVALVDAADPDLKAASVPVLRAEIERAAEHEATLVERASALEAAGWHVQVPVMDGGVNLFVEGPAGRERLYRQDGAFRLRHSGESMDRVALLEKLASDPSTVSPNVLLRPVVESAVFPTLAYVAGPGEATYWAQLAPLFRAHGVAMPAVIPRPSVTVLERKVGKVLDKFSLSVDELSRPFHEIAGDVARDEMPDGVRRALGELRGAIAQGATKLEKEAKGVDATLGGPVQHVRSAALEALGEAEKKIVQAVKRQSDITLQQIEKARLHLFPDGTPQERVLNVVYYLARYGDAFLADVARVLRANLADALGVQGAEEGSPGVPAAEAESAG